MMMTRTSPSTRKSEDDDDDETMMMMTMMTTSITQLHDNQPDDVPLILWSTSDRECSTVGEGMIVVPVCVVIVPWVLTESLASFGAFLLVIRSHMRAWTVSAWVRFADV